MRGQSARLVRKSLYFSLWRPGILTYGSKHSRILIIMRTLWYSEHSRNFAPAWLSREHRVAVALLMKKKKKFRLERDSNPWPLRYRRRALPIELSSYRNSLSRSYKCDDRSCLRIFLRSSNTWSFIYSRKSVALDRQNSVTRTFIAFNILLQAFLWLSFDHVDQSCEKKIQKDNHLVLPIVTSTENQHG